MPIQTKILTHFADAASLLTGQRATLFLTQPWLQSWWETRGQGKLLLTQANGDNEPVALAPLFCEDGTIMFLGAGESDSMDFVGDPTAAADANVLTALLDAARSAIPDFNGFKLTFLPAMSPTVRALPAVAEKLGLHLSLRDELTAFDVDLKTNADFMRAATNRSMFKREDYFQRNGSLEIHQLTTAADVLPQLGEFFQLHIDRWQGKDWSSPFTQPSMRAWLERVVESTAAAGWLRVLRLQWNGALLAMGFAWHYDGVHYCGPWSFDPTHAKHCPGHVLLRHWVLAALDAGLHTYDLRGGEEHYKDRFPTRSHLVQTWGLYPP